MLGETQKDPSSSGMDAFLSVLLFFPKKEMTLKKTAAKLEYLELEHQVSH